MPVAEGQLRNGDQRPMRAGGGGRQSIGGGFPALARGGIAILFSQLAHGPSDMHAGTSGEAGVVDTRHEIWHVRVRWGGFGDLGECGNEVLWGDRRGSCEELAGMLPPIGCARVGPPGIERCGRQVGSCCAQKRDVEPGVMGSLTSPDGGPRDSHKAAFGLLSWLAAGADTGGAVVSVGGCGAGVVGAGGFTGPAHPAVQLQVPRPVTRSYSQRVTAPRRLHPAHASRDFFFPRTFLRWSVVCRVWGTYVSRLLRQPAGVCSQAAREQLTQRHLLVVR